MHDHRIVLLGQNIRKIRKELGLSQEALANESGLDRAYVGKIERGEKNITVAKLLQIVDALGIATSELFEFK